MVSPELERLLNRLPTEGRAQAAEMLVSMDKALEHATKRLNLEFESADQVSAGCPATLLALSPAQRAVRAADLVEFASHKGLAQPLSAHPGCGRQCKRPCNCRSRRRPT